LRQNPEAFVKTFKCDYVSVNPTPDAETVIAQLPLWFEHYKVSFTDGEFID
jgi:hypothetical protein